MGKLNHDKKNQYCHRTVTDINPDKISKKLERKLLLYSYEFKVIFQYKMDQSRCAKMYSIKLCNILCNLILKLGIFSLHKSLLKTAGENTVIKVVFCRNGIVYKLESFF